MRDDIEAMIEAYDLHPLPPEGGWFRRTGAGDEDTTGRPAWSSILLLLTEGEFSGMHRLPFDELWFYHQGGPLEMLLLAPDGEAHTVLLGADPGNGEQPQRLVPAGWWMGARTIGAWTLAGTYMCPGFHPDDYEGGDADELAAAYPAAEEQIRALCRTDAAVRMGGTGANPTAKH